MANGMEVVGAAALLVLIAFAWGALAFVCEVRRIETGSQRRGDNQEVQW